MNLTITNNFYQKHLVTFLKFVNIIKDKRQFIGVQIMNNKRNTL